METRLKTVDILKDFYKVTGARISLHDLDFNEIAAYPESLSFFCNKMQQQDNVRNQCHLADELAFKKVRKSGLPYTYKCHCGLIETVAPIYNYGTLTGYFMMGQITDDAPDSIVNIKKSSAAYFSNNYELDAACKNIPVLNSDMINSYINILEIIAEYMTQTNRLTAKNRDLAASVKSYIHKFYQKKLSIELLCETFYCSRTTLINTFRNKYGKTIGDYITSYRIEKAEEILLNSEKSIKSIALECGFSDQNYFTKVFTKKNNCTPSRFREGIK